MKTRTIAFITLCSAVLFSVDGWAQKGNLILIGGGKRPASVMRKITSLQKEGEFLIVPMASSLADTIGREHADTLKKYGAKQIRIMLMNESDSLNTEIVDSFRNAGGIWFSGGNQNRLMAYVGNKAIRNAIKEAYEKGAVIAGTSAGTAIQSEKMITGEERYPISEHVYFGQIRPHNTILTSGLGLIKGIIIDQHFIRRSRTNRLISALLDEPEKVAIGIDEATALWVKPDNQFEVLGDGQVLIFEETSDMQFIPIDSLHGVFGLKMHLIPTGKRFSIDKKNGKILLNIN